ncbi:MULTISPECIES: pilin [unclassified Nocardia]|uniref:pilin n=1 Tax=unclassified Nocardia TaxID=2637762 RepID=UPI001CE3E3D2|nr:MULTISPECIES: pilin [unclassified Nocardia]
MRMITRLPAPPSVRGCPERPRRGLLTRTLVCAAALGCALVVACGSAGAHPVSVSVLAVADSLDQVLTNLRNWLVGILALIATVCLTVGGARYLICAGDPSEVERAKTALKAACLGYALAMLAPVVVAVLKSIVGG